MRHLSGIASAFAVVTAALFASSCLQNELEQPGIPEYITGITVIGEDVDFSDFDTKVSYTDRLAFSWDNGDRLGIFPIGGRQQLFPLSDVGNGSSANFDGGAWALRSSYEYAGYYPYTTDKSDTDDMMLAVDYRHQKQDGNGSTASLGELSYMVAEATRPNNAGSVNLQMKQVGGVIRVEATVPENVNYRQATIYDNTAEMIVGGKIDLAHKSSPAAVFTPSVLNPEYSNHVTIDLENVKVQPADGANNLIFYFWLPPQSLSGHDLTLVLEEEGGRLFSLDTTCSVDVAAAKGKRIDFGSVAQDEDVDYLRFTASEEYSAEARIFISSNNVDFWDGPNVEYSFDKKNWIPMRNEYPVDVQPGRTIYLRGENETFSQSGILYTTIRLVGDFYADGNVMTLLDKSGRRDDVPDYCFLKLFFGSSFLLSAPELPAMHLGAHCYDNMFSGCSNLETAPELPAEDLAEACYYQMFMRCPSLVNIPEELPAETLADQCYAYMFANCESLEIAPVLPAGKMEDGCYISMFSGCTGLSIAPELPATKLAPNCYSNMFGYCSSLEEAPELPAKNLERACYFMMFTDCVNLISTPLLPAEKLADMCYFMMFERCSNLSVVRADFTEIGSSSLALWLIGVSETGTFYKNPKASWTNSQIDLPEGWTIVDRS